MCFRIEQSPEEKGLLDTQVVLLVITDNTFLEISTF